MNVMELDLLQTCMLCRKLFFVCISVLLLTTELHAPSAMAIDLPVPLSAVGFHPSQVLSSSSLSSSSLTSSSERINSAMTMKGDEIQEDEVLYHLYRNGRSKKDYRKPSTRFMVSLFNELQRGGSLTSSKSSGTSTDTIRSFSGQNSRETRKGRPVVDFYIPYLPPHERLRNAEIRFLRNPKAKNKPRKYKFRIDVRKNGKIVNKFKLRERSVIQHQYDVFDVTNIVNSWINNEHGNFSLHVRMSKKLQRQTMVALKDTTMQSTSLIVLYLEDSDFLKNMYTSFTSEDDNDVVSETSSEASQRRKRDLSSSMRLSPYYKSLPLILEPERNATIRHKRDSAKVKRRNRKTRKWFRAGRKESCQLYDFEVDFNAIGWGQWIIHPKRFNSRFCFGLCPSPIDVKYKPTNHAMLQTLMRMKRPNVAPVPCCVPTKLNPVSMLYFEYDEIVVRHHEDMVAEECGCR